MLNSISLDTTVPNPEYRRHHSSSTSGSRRYGTDEGHSTHVGEAIEIFNEAWSKTSRSTILKFCVKSTCFSTNQFQKASRLINSFQEDTQNDLTIMFYSVFQEPKIF